MNNLLVDLQNEEVDVKTTISRFMDNEEIYLTFLYRFPDEKQFYSLKQKIECHEYDDNALAIAHNLKGLTANLGMNRIYSLTMKIMSDIRNSRYDYIDETFSMIEENYNKICKIIHRYKIVK